MTGGRYPPTYGSAPPSWGQHPSTPSYFTPTPASLACPAQNTSETYTQQVSYRPNPKSTTTTKSQKKSCLLLSSEAFNSHFGVLLCVTHQIVTLRISVISAFSVFSDFSLLYLPHKLSHFNMHTLLTYNYNDMTWFMNFNPNNCGCHIKKSAGRFSSWLIMYE